MKEILFGLMAVFGLGIIDRVARTPAPESAGLSFPSTKRTSTIQQVKWIKTRIVAVIIIGLILIIGSLCFRWMGFGIARGLSMTPNLLPGQLFAIRQIAINQQIVNKIIVFNDKMYGGRSVKRVKSINNDGSVMIAGDNRIYSEEYPKAIQSEDCLGLVQPLKTPWLARIVLSFSNDSVVFVRDVIFASWQKEKTRIAHNFAMANAKRKISHYEPEVEIGTFGVGKGNMFDFTPGSGDWSPLLKPGTFIMVGQKKCHVVSAKYNELLGAVTVIIKENLSPLPPQGSKIKLLPKSE